MKNMTDIDVLAVTMLEPEAVRYLAFPSYLYFTYLHIYFVFFLFLYQVTQTEYLGKIF